jgi:CheY-like chemotaxis protein
MHILIADDEADLAWAIQRSLRDEGYEVSCAYDGLQALTLARQSRPDLVILDIVMPNLSGLEVCHRIRQDASLGYIPILFLTVRSAIEDRVYGLDSGCDDYMSSPLIYANSKRVFGPYYGANGPPRPRKWRRRLSRYLASCAAASLDLHNRQLYLPAGTSNSLRWNSRSCTT